MRADSIGEASEWACASSRIERFLAARACRRSGSRRPGRLCRSGRRSRGCRYEQFDVKPRLELSEHARVEPGLRARGKASPDVGEAFDHALRLRMTLGRLVGEGEVDQALAEPRRLIQEAKSGNAKLGDGLDVAVRGVGRLSFTKPRLGKARTRREYVLPRRLRSQSGGENRPESEPHPPSLPESQGVSPLSKSRHRVRKEKSIGSATRQGSDGHPLSFAA
jgi:hypothetical protein